MYACGTHQPPRAGSRGARPGEPDQALGMKIVATLYPLERTATTRRGQRSRAPPKQAKLQLRGRRREASETTENTGSGNRSVPSAGLPTWGVAQACLQAAAGLDGVLP